MKIKVNNQTWKVKEVSSQNYKLVIDGTYRQGATHFHKQTVYLSKKLSKERKREVLLHELTHCFLYATQAYYNKESFSEEELCEVMALYGEKITDIMRTYFERKQEKRNR